LFLRDPLDDEEESEEITVKWLKILKDAHEQNPSSEDTRQELLQACRIAVKPERKNFYAKLHGTDLSLPISIELTAMAAKLLRDEALFRDVLALDWMSMPESCFLEIGRDISSFDFKLLKERYANSNSLLQRKYC
jgi:hypothetical protein